MAILYKAPLRDIDFVMNEVFDFDGHYKKLGFENADKETVQSIVSECAKLATNTLAPLNAVGDKEGCRKVGDDVFAPPGFKEAYNEYIMGGWQGLSVPEEYGGQALPMSLAMVKAEIIGTANWSFGMYPGLSLGCMNTLMLHASEEQKNKYLPKLAEGTWSGTMCLTEPQCGTDLSQVRTKAVPQKDGSFKLSGTKIYISAGEHDLTENIIHIVLARKEGAPPGLRGISLFLVPKFLEKADGKLETKRNITCGSIEKKMGIHGSPTCVMNFDESVGYLIGEENTGLKQMFTFMNTARIGTGLQGLGAAELAYQGAAPYAAERMSLRSLSGVKHPDKVADPIIVHADVRRMLLTCKAIAEGGRAMTYDIARVSDTMIMANASDAMQLDDILGLQTPILKGFLTEAGNEAANLGMQCFGGHGFVQDYGMEQIVRDARIGTLYEGTTGIQALDLLGRKVLLTGGANLREFTSEILSLCWEVLVSKRATSTHKREALALSKYTIKWLTLTARIAFKARSNPDVVGAASVDYLMYSGYVSLGYYWLRMMETASKNLLKDPYNDTKFYNSKIATGKFYFGKLLPKAEGHAATMLSPVDSVMGMREDEFMAAYDK